jgi:hypothetical protein
VIHQSWDLGDQTSHDALGRGINSLTRLTFTATAEGRIPLSAGGLQRGEKGRGKVVLASKVYGGWAIGPTAASCPLYLSRRHARTACVARDRSPRHLSDAPCRPRDFLGKDLASDGAAGPGGEDRVCGQLELCWLAHLTGQRASRSAQFPRLGFRAMSVQPPAADGGDGGPPGLPIVRSWGDRMEPFGRRPSWGAR